MDDIEQSLIGSIILSKNTEAVEKCMNTICAKMFNDTYLGKLFDESKVQFLKLGKIDPVLVYKNLGDEYKKIIAQCCEYVAAPSLLPQYSQKLFEEYRKRLLLESITEIKNDIDYNSPLSAIMPKVDDMIAVQKKLDEASDSSTSLDFIESCVEFINLLSNKSKASLKMGITLFDYILGGFAPKSVNVIAGRSGMGKTDFALYIAVSLAMRKARVLYLTMEMPRTQIMSRIVSRITRIDSTKIRDKELYPDDYASINTALDKISRIPLTFDEQQNLSVDDIRQKINKHKPDVVIIDHFGLMKTDKYKKRCESIADNSVELKKLAMEQNIAIIELVQQNTNAEKRADSTACLSDLKGSDGIGNDADCVMFIRADKNGAESVLKADDSYKAYLQIEKNRSGRTGTIQFDWQPQFHNYKIIDRRIDD